MIVLCAIKKCLCEPFSLSSELSGLGDLQSPAGRPRPIEYQQITYILFVLSSWWFVLQKDKGKATELKHVNDYRILCLSNILITFK